MRKTITAILMGILLIGTFGAVAVSAVASEDAGKGYVSGPMNRWAARYADSGDGAGDRSYCPCYGTGETTELEVKTADEAYEIAKSEIDDSISRDDIYQKGRWWIVYYEDEDGIHTQARIDAMTGEVFTGYSTLAGAQMGGRHGRGSGHGRGPGNCMGYGN
ncbi:MAG: PepSY domain-containing protein [Methanosarcina mazei]|nr:PepSY domain-containing protein [Methanosarcina mazei]